LTRVVHFVERVNPKLKNNYHKLKGLK